MGSASAERLRGRWSIGLVLLCLFCVAITPAFAQVSKESQVKAVCLWRLAQFVDWPTNAFENANSPIVIGVLGENPFGDALDAAVRGETAHGRPFLVQPYQRVAEIKSCHILFVSRSETARVKEVTAALRGRSILTVSDIENFALAHDGMVRFMTEQNRIKLRINLEAALAAGLVIDARLLRMAEVLRTK